MDQAQPDTSKTSNPHNLLHKPTVFRSSHWSHVSILKTCWRPKIPPSPECYHHEPSRISKELQLEDKHSLTAILSPESKVSTPFMSEITLWSPLRLSDKFQGLIVKTQRAHNHKLTFSIAEKHGCVQGFVGSRPKLYGRFGPTLVPCLFSGSKSIMIGVFNFQNKIKRRPLWASTQIQKLLNHCSAIPTHSISWPLGTFLKKQVPAKHPTCLYFQKCPQIPKYQNFPKLARPADPLEQNVLCATDSLAETGFGSIRVWIWALWSLHFAWVSGETGNRTICSQRLSIADKRYHSVIPTNNVRWLGVI